MELRSALRWLKARRWTTQLAVVGTLAVGVLLGTLISNGVRAARDVVAPDAKPLSIPSPAELSSTFSQVAKAVEPTVVNINTESVVTRDRRRRSTPDAPDPFQDFFERFFDFGPPERFRSESLGSGVIVDPNGYILTNYHVVEDADKIDVRLPGEEKNYRAKVVGYDNETDLAVIKIEAGRKLPAAKMGNSDAVEVGDWVLAIGSPFGLQATVTAGIISYKGRPGMQQFQRFIQTDAAINRGNSGGPLVNLAGEVIGINTAIMSSQGVYAGVGFALPSNIAVEVYNQLIQHGRMVRGSIGIYFDSTVARNPAVLRSFGAEHGVVVDRVVEGGPAARAGLRHGDVIYRVDDTPILNGEDLVNKVASTPVGQSVKIYYIREKEKRETKVSIEDRATLFSAEIAGSPRPDAQGEEASQQLGLTLEELNASTARRAGLSEDEAGLLVRDVEPGSFADEIGLQRNDVILEFNQQAVRTLREFRARQRELEPGSDVVFYIKRPTPNGWVGTYRGGTLPH
ncbi:MAG: Do family serine endopeptidase [Acidobacteria bacterium]|nr:Do family serine endopeptidase [Acidobacteriota bacterium]